MDEAYNDDDLGVDVIEVNDLDEELDGSFTVEGSEDGYMYDPEVDGSFTVEGNDLDEELDGSFTVEAKEDDNNGGT